jgi:hypothetical protein
LVAEYAAPTYGNIWVATPYFPGRLFFFDVQDMDDSFDLEMHFEVVRGIVGSPFHECSWGVFNGIIAQARPFTAIA